MFTLIPVSGVASLWLRVEPMIRSAIAKGETTSEVLMRIYRGEAQLWCVMENNEPIAAIVTQTITECDGRRVCNIWATAGKDMDRWFHFLETIEAWAADIGCEAIGIEQARPGWKRLMKGYKVTHVSLEKEL